MNNELEEFARKQILAGLRQLPESNRVIFKRMYSPEDLDADIEAVVTAMPAERLDWAMQQVSRSLAKDKEAKG